jgi:hypothetical protein
MRGVPNGAVGRVGPGGQAGRLEAAVVGPCQSWLGRAGDPGVNAVVHGLPLNELSWAGKTDGVILNTIQLL